MNQPEDVQAAAEAEGLDRSVPLLYYNRLLGYGPAAVQRNADIVERAFRLNLGVWLRPIQPDDGTVLLPTPQRGALQRVHPNQAWYGSPAASQRPSAHRSRGRCGAVGAAGWTTCSTLRTRFRGNGKRCCWRSRVSTGTGPRSWS